MKLLQSHHSLKAQEGGIYTISYINRLDLDFEDIDSVIYIGSTRSFRRRYTQHSKEFDDGHSNWLLKKVGRRAKRNNQELNFIKLLTLPRLSLNTYQYDKILRAVEQWFIHLNRPYQDIEHTFNGDDVYRHRLANWSDAIPTTHTNSEALVILLSSYNNMIDEVAIKAIIQ
ncbi:hypothetical protein AB4289_06110 [Vibrio cyclitrophicus]